jgi:hypothetical protein
MDKNTYAEINEKMDFLLEDHGVDFDNSNLDLESLDTLHRKADALLSAHKIDIPEVEKDVIGLQPKLNLLIEGHGAEFYDSELDPSSFETVIEKLDVLVHEHGN